MRRDPFAKRSILLSITARLALKVALLVGLLPITPTITTLAGGDTSLPPRHSPGVLEAGGAGQVPPAGLSGSEWGSIQEQIRRAEYHLTWHEPSAAYTAPNRAHGWHTAFSATGVQVTPHTPGGGWSWGLALTGYGYEGYLQPIADTPAQTVEANRVEFHHDTNLTEWYANDDAGLKHGFALATPPTSDIPHPTSHIAIEMALDTTLTPSLADGGQTILFRDAAPSASSGQRGQSTLRYGELYVYDATGRALPAHLNLITQHATLHTPYAIRITLDATNATYPITIDPLLTSQVAKLTAADGAAWDELGRSVGISGDTVVIGAYGDESYRGAAYVFARNQGGADNWGQVAKLTAADGAAADYFGASVGISEGMVVVGAYGDESFQGAAYIFERNQGGADHWGQVTKLTATDGAAGDAFGASVGISGDTVVLGADGDESDRGAAYIFDRNRGGADNWGQVTKLTATDGATDDLFGISVGISGDTVVVGANGDESYRGAAYAFERNQGGTDTWGQATKLTAADGATDDEFGVSVGISGDTIIIGAESDESNRGAAYVFERNQGGADHWGQAAKLAALDGAADDYFGGSVDISGDTIVVGAYGDESERGAAYVFESTSAGGVFLPVVLKNVAL